MSTKQQRGTKRTCQSSECGSRFYDLGRSPIVCPICGSIYEIASSPAALAASGMEDKRKPKKPEFAINKEHAPEAESEAVAEEALVDIEAGEETEIAAEDDETFLEPEEETEGGDMSNIIGGPVQEGGEET
jgi:uncharacterized protein (TIGR02300 family)